MRFFVPLLALFTLVTSLIASARAESTFGSTEQAIVVHFKYGSRDLKRLFELEDKLESALAKVKVGSYDGNEVATDGSDGFLYFYGPSADRLYEVVKPVLLSANYMAGAKVTLRYGPPKVGVPQKSVVLQN
jgi:hypothetical protein